MLKQQFNLKLQQKLSPMQIQGIKMLELPALELEERVRQELVDNPALELGREEGGVQEEFWNEGEDKEAELQKEKDEMLEWAWKDDDNSDNTPSYRLNANNYSSNESSAYRELSANMSFVESLKQQLYTLGLSDNIKRIAEYVIGNIDADAYLRRENEQMIDDMLMLYGVEVSEEEMYLAVKAIQMLEPAGVGAHNLQECLTLQLVKKEKTNDINTAIAIVAKCFDLLARGAYEVIAKKIEVDAEAIKKAMDIITHLNPKPGDMFVYGAESLSQTIAPDFRVDNINGKLSVELITVNIPELRVSREYNIMVEDYVGNKSNQTRQTKEAIVFARKKIDAARWFIDAIKQRNNTLLLVMQTIVDMQKEFFQMGDDCMLKPMRLKDVAERIGYDISTISRVSNSKYVETEWGIISLKYFFTESMQTVHGDEVSSKEIKYVIREFVDLEDKQNPTADDELTKILNDKGYIVARRTVAKYREQLNIPVARLRRIRI